MPKVTAKHYLNVNLKPYVIRGEKFYPVYVLVTSFRKTTKVKSNVFAELQTESDFEELVKSKEAKEEIATIELLTETINSITQQPFDTVLFSLIYNQTPNHFCGARSLLSEVLRGNKKIGSLLLEELYSSTNQNGPSFFEWYSPKWQKRIKKFLLSRGIKEDGLTIVNEVALFCFFEILSIVIMVSPIKYRVLKDKYPFFLEDYREFALNSIKKV